MAALSIRWRDRIRAARLSNLAISQQINNDLDLTIKAMNMTGPMVPYVNDIEYAVVALRSHASTLIPPNGD